MARADDATWKTAADAKAMAEGARFLHRVDRLPKRRRFLRFAEPLSVPRAKLLEAAWRGQAAVILTSACPHWVVQVQS